MVASLVFTLLLLSAVAYGFICRVSSCITCSSSPVDCIVTPIDQYSYNYYCEAPPDCTPQNVPGTNLNGHYCFASLFIRNLNSTEFVGHWFNFNHGDSCEEVAGSELTNDCLNITKRVSSLEGITSYVICRCKQDNCQDIFNVTIIIDPPNDVSSSTLINGVITSSPSPSSVHSSVPLSLSLSSSTIVDNVMSSSLIRATTALPSTPTLIPPFTTTPSSNPTTNTVSAITTALGKSYHALATSIPFLSL
uniref:UPAR/Ly6 domain-containing protein n=1 Tax=Amphimedon queenslandica TaxID=400682 RepID=A0A1X7VC69_AMPQE